MPDNFAAMTEVTQRADSERGSLGVAELFVLPLVLVITVGVILKMNGVTISETTGGWLFYLAWLVIALRTARRKGLHLRALLRIPERPKDWALILVVIPILAFGVTLLYLVFYGVSYAAPDTFAEILAEPDDPETGAARVWSVLLQVLGAAVVEELVFRGVLLELWGLRRAVIGTSLVFGVLHLSEPASGVIFGFAMAALYLGSGTLVLPIAAHMLHNVAPAMVEFLDDDSGVMTLAEYRDGAWQMGLAFVAAVILLVAFFRYAAARPVLFTRPWHRENSRIPTAPSGASGT